MAATVDPNHLTNICAQFNLALVEEGPKRAYGGLLHTLWQIRTDQSSYAIKQLSADVHDTHEDVIKKYELSERIAACFLQRGVPALPAMNNAGRHLVFVDKRRT